MRRGRAREARKKRKLQREMELEKKRKLQREENETKEAASMPRTEETEPKVARTEETEPNEAASKPKMVVNAYDDGDDPKFAAARRGMIAAGYQIDGCRIEEIHCEKAKFTWMENGFCQTYCYVDGKRARVLHYAPGQNLQPHEHDCDERFIIGGGAVTLISWPRGLDEEPDRTRLVAGDVMEVPQALPHALHADVKMGLQFHEIVGDFGTRSTKFHFDRRGLVLDAEGRLEPVSGRDAEQGNGSTTQNEL